MVGQSLRILIGVPTAEFARKATFYDYFNVIDKPEGTMATFAHGQSPARNRNVIIEQALANNCTHILFLDDDVLPPTDIVHKLVRHNKDIVTGLYLMRQYPHRPIAFRSQNSDGFVQWEQLSPDKNGLVEVVSTGLGCVLINTQVFMKMDKPWIRLGEIESDHWSDDIGFFKRARALGYKIYLDTDVRCGHIQSFTLWPDLVNGQWLTKIESDSLEGSVAVPQIYQEMANVHS